MSETAKFILSFFMRKGKSSSRWRDIKTGRFVKRPLFYRFVWGTKGIPWHGSYVSFAYFYWGFEKPIDGEDELVEYMEKWLGYSEGDWWFDFKVGFGKMQWEYDEELDGKEEYEP